MQKMDGVVESVQPNERYLQCVSGWWVWMLQSLSSSLSLPLADIYKPTKPSQERWISCPIPSTNSFHCACQNKNGV